MQLPLSFILKNTSTDLLSVVEGEIDEIMFDSRKQNVGTNTLFVDLAGNAKHIEQARKKGVGVFLTSLSIEEQEGEVVIKVENVLDELQKLAARYRAELSAQVIAITGSNGKTITKEWVYAVLQSKFVCGKSPASYNSQLGVPLSLLGITEQDEIAIIEAGISEVGEMEKLEKMISPRIGILTTMGDAHSDGFNSMEEKIKEKIILFKDCQQLIAEINNVISIGHFSSLENTELITWSFTDARARYQASYVIENDKSRITLNGKNSYEFIFPLTDNASITNIIHVIILALEFNVSSEDINAAISTIQPISLRLELKKAGRNCLLINDSYNADLTSLRNALDFAITQKSNRSLTLILSEFDQQSNSSLFVSQLNKLISSYPIDQLYFVGNKSKDIFADNTFEETGELLNYLIKNKPSEELILIKGARRFKLEMISSFLEENQHRTILHTNLQVLNSNIKYFKSLTKLSTKVMAVIKAGAYGSDSLTIGKYLESSGIDYLAVAYIEEGIELRNEGIKSPIMVMNPDPSLLSLAKEYDLEPEIYSLHQLRQVNDLGAISIHLKIDSGMHRLGFGKEDVHEVLDILNSNKNIKIRSIFSHLSSADDRSQHSFSKEQDVLFSSIYERIVDVLGYTPLKHICNSHAAIAFPEMHYDMIRIGIGMHGLMRENSLKSTHKLVSYISQVKEIVKGESVGYNQSFIASGKMSVATISIGYADGISRKHGGGKSVFYVRGTACPTVGNISMDSCSVDVSEVDCLAGDEVVIFENKEQMFSLCETAEVIPYEFICGIGKRVARKFSVE